MRCPSCRKSLWSLRTFCPFCNTKISAPPRPKSTTVVSWLFIALGLIGLNRVVVGPLLIPPFAQYYIQFRSEHPVQYALLFIHPAVLILSGAFLLMGRNWARWLLVAWIVSVGTASAWNQNFRIAAFDLVWLAVAVYYLFRPAATAFFIGPFQSVKAEPEERVADQPVERMAEGTAEREVGHAGPPPPLT